MLSDATGNARARCASSRGRRKREPREPARVRPRIAAVHGTDARVERVQFSRVFHGQSRAFKGDGCRRVQDGSVEAAYEFLNRLGRPAGREGIASKDRRGPRRATTAISFTRTACVCQECA
ncbi:hypothetical protein NUW54_g10504 [Trametes sanguinea]|uniref:Uncharacterized protein n=1 Tax=Trametes sanguinea TaxID=158606 RepID=A0ACC1P0X0_9APHY|nr:hypothetical protein NUW54_g10504 [Trametes sanguinea]